MDRVEMVGLITGVPDHASEALNDLKRLERAGWIEVTCYAMLDKDAWGAIRVQKAGDSVATVSLAAAGGAGGLLSGWPFGPAGEAPEAAQAWPGGNTETLKENLQPGETALMVVLEERYADRVMEELETRGRTLRKQLLRSERVAALRASVERAATNVKWLVDFLRSESARAEWAEGGEKEELEAAIAAGRAELNGERENLHARLKALAAEIEADLRETRDVLERADGDGRALIETHISALESAVTVCTNDLVLSFLDQMESLASHACELKTKAAVAGAEAAKAIEEQLHELEVRMRKYRAELTATLGSSAARARHCLDSLRVEAVSANAELRLPLENLMKRLDKQHAIMKADLRRLEKEDTRVWHERTAAFRKSWCELFESVDRAMRKHH